MLKITAEEIHFIIYQYLHESGFEHSSFVFAQEANMHENRFNEYRIPSGMLIVFLEKALTLIHMETHLDDNEEIKECRQPYTLLTPHTCDISVEQTSRQVQEQERENMLMQDEQPNGHVHKPSYLTDHHNMNTMNGGALQDSNMQQHNNHYNRMSAPPQQQQQYYAQAPHNHNQQMIDNQALYHQQQMYHQAQLYSSGQFQQENQQQYQRHQQLAQQPVVQALPPVQGEVLQHCAEKGVFLLQAEGESLEISSALFSPKQRLLVTGGNYYLATMWDLQRDPSQQLYGDLQGHLPHVKRHTDTQVELQADVSSVHWSHDGTRLVTSSNDMMARIWRLDKETGHFNIESVKSFGVMLMNSKFNKPPATGSYTQLVATGGHSGVVTVWNCSTIATDNTNKDVCKLVHQQLDPGLEGIELDWQSPKTLAVTGNSKNIYLWNIATPQQPIQVWSGGHTDEVEQIKWDPSGRLLASCSSDNRVCIWKTEQAHPAHVFEDFSSESRINQVQWSCPSSSSEANCPTLLAAGSQDGHIAIWNVNERHLCFKLQAHCSEVGGVKCMAFSPNNRMIASGGQDFLSVWQLPDLMELKKEEPQLLKVWQKPAGVYSEPNPSKASGSGATTTQIGPSNQGQGLQAKGSGKNYTALTDSEFSQVSWSHDGLLLVAAIHNRIAVFDARKFSTDQLSKPAHQAKAAKPAPSVQQQQ